LDGNCRAICVTRVLVPVGVSYCFGDGGVDTPCPCGNDNDFNASNGLAITWEP